MIEIESIVSICRVIIAMILILFLPGFLLINALLPEKKVFDLQFDIFYRIGIGIGLSIGMSIAVGFLLGRTLGLKTENIFIVLSIISLVLFVIGVYRGAYPRIYRKRYVELKNLEKRLNELLEIAEIYRNRMRNMPPSFRKLYENKLKDIMIEIENIKNEIEKRKTS